MAKDHDERVVRSLRELQASSQQVRAGVERDDAEQDVGEDPAVVLGDKREVRKPGLRTAKRVDQVGFFTASADYRLHRRNVDRTPGGVATPRLS